MHESELFGRTLRVNLAKPLRIKEGSTRPVWQDEEWLQMYSGKKTEEENNTNNGTSETNDITEEAAALKRAAKDAIASSVEVFNNAIFFCDIDVQNCLSHRGRNQRKTHKYISIARLEILMLVASSCSYMLMLFPKQLKTLEHYVQGKLELATKDRFFIGLFLDLCVSIK